jgi:hypothetical protein
MLTTAGMLRSDLVSNSLTRRRPQNVVGSGGVSRRRVTFGDETLGVCLFVVAGLILLGGLLMLLSWVTATFPTRELKSCSDFEGGVAPATDGEESLWTEDLQAGRLKITR